MFISLGLLAVIVGVVLIWMHQTHQNVLAMEEKLKRQNCEECEEYHERGHECSHDPYEDDDDEVE